MGGGQESTARRKQQSNGEFGHSDDITSLDVSSDKTLVATGSVGQKPMVFVWDATTAQKLHFMRLPKGSRSTNGMAFSPDSSKLAVSDMSNDFKIHVFSLTVSFEEGQCPLICSGKADSKPCTMI